MAITLENFAGVLESRIQTRLKRMSPADPRMNEVLLRIGIMIETEAKLNIRRKHIIDTGTLFNSIRYKLFKQNSVSGVSVGSYGVPYAAAHEFGFNGPVTVRTHTRNQTVAFGKRIPAKPVTVGSFTRFMRVQKRPYLRPAVKAKQEQIIALLRGLVGVK